MIIENRISKENEETKQIIEKRLNDKTGLTKDKPVMK